MMAPMSSHTMLPYVHGAVLVLAASLGGCSILVGQIDRWCTEDGVLVDSHDVPLDGSCGTQDAGAGAEAGAPDAGIHDAGEDGGEEDSGVVDGGADTGVDAGPSMPPIDPYRRLATGWTHTCAVSDGNVYCWGNNSDGQLGTGTTDDSRIPIQVPGLPSSITEVSATGYFTCALSGAGEVFCWGNNDLGQLGDGTRESRLSPVRSVSALSDVVRISAGGESACALHVAGTVSCWGRGTGGALGNGGLSDSLTPVNVINIEGVLGIEGSGGHYCVRTELGSVSCWGWSRYEQLGVVYDGTAELIPTAVSPLGLSGVVQASAGGRHTCIRNATSIACWGWNMFGQLGNGGSGPDTHTPVVVGGLPDPPSDISAGGSHTCALLESEDVYCWGGNAKGQLGAGDRMERGMPTRVSGFTSPVVQLSAGDFHTCALLSTGDVACWGGNIDGQLGNGTIEDSLTPQVVDVAGT